jgi:hypothetical protein
MEQVDLDYLRDLSRHNQWAILLKYLRKCEEVALKELAGFKTADEALKRQGKVEGIGIILRDLTELYNLTRLQTEHQANVNASTARESAKPREQFAGKPAATPGKLTTGSY